MRAIYNSKYNLVEYYDGSKIVSTIQIEDEDKGEEIVMLINNSYLMGLIDGKLAEKSMNKVVAKGTV